MSKRDEKLDQLARTILVATQDAFVEGGFTSVRYVPGHPVQKVDWGGIDSIKEGRDHDETPHLPFRDVGDEKGDGS